MKQMENGSVRAGRCAACLTVAGSDSGGNAGVQADLRTFHAYALHGCTVFAALTAQNPFGVSAIHPVPPEFVASQMDAVLGVYDIRAIKTGMLADAEVIEVVVDRFSAYPEIVKVVDPVMVATSGAKLICDEAVVALKEKLFPHATVITPNIPEAEALAGMSIENRSSMCDAARFLYERYGSAVVVKGGHSVSESAEDVLCCDEGLFVFSSPWIADPVSTHGTGCTFAAALAAELSLGRNVCEAVGNAKGHVREAVRNACHVGDGCGVLGFVRESGSRYVSCCRL